ncbi:iron transporter [Streptomyces sp. NBC_01728]|uniref:IucA/IucC family protein n=1 Tax=unclassified Streptomyces TaxID=2593676 RepID=UPI0022554655|nr:MULTISPECIES: IucA/IucC family protein [unclassified Streptomyces]MCX4457332.1 iron transporter [Streptomyces sp. NBC_01719]MCX4496689.1 iron transporter [Streptomyces sp. NBC_01728]MCX4588724.1 iron transporter [Streptomyces sp. NBC_01549]
MNATPASDGRPDTHERAACATQTPLVAGADAVPRQKGGARETERLRGATADLLEHPAVHTAAQAAAVENLLRCWVRENNLAAPTDGTLRIPLPASGVSLLTPVHYWSPTGWHRFGLPHLADAPDGAPPADAVTVAALLARQAAMGLGTTSTAVVTSTSVAESGPGGGADLVGRVADSVRRTVVFINDRRQRPADTPDLFLAAEQALVLGHPWHPTPKSREGFSEAEARLYSPELRGSFPLHWMAVAPSVLAAESAWTERGRPVPAQLLTARLAGAGLPLPDGYAALPLHPWQMAEVRHRPETAALLDAGLLRDLGPHGSAWHPTSSVRTLYRSGAPAMLKLSLGLRITNSRRENLRKELHRGVEVHRLLRGGLSKQWQSAHPGFDIVRDPAWLAVNAPDGTPLTGLDVMIRHNPFGPTDDAGCVAGLVSPRPHAQPGARGGSEDRPVMRSRLAEIVTRLAGRTSKPRGAVAAEWFLRYLEQVVRPVLWLDSEAGIALEAHQQNTLLVLDPEGWPAGGRYRDNQGYYFRESRRAELDARLPGIGELSDTFVSDEVTDERFAYYLAINNVLGLIGAFGSQHLADEQLLLAAFRRFLTEAASGPARLRTPLPARLLDSPVLRCKANLLTRLHGLDELVGPVDTQSVYVALANPLHS